MSPDGVQATFAEIFSSIESVGAVFWPLVILLVLLLILRVGAAIAGIGYDCGRLLVWTTALLVTALQLPAAAQRALPMSQVNRVSQPAENRAIRQAHASARLKDPNWSLPSPTTYGPRPGPKIVVRKK